MEKVQSENGKKSTNGWKWKKYNKNVWQWKVSEIVESGLALI